MTDKTRQPASPQRRKFLRDAGLIPAGIYLGAGISRAGDQGADAGAQAGESMMDYVAPILDTVRVAYLNGWQRHFGGLSRPSQRTANR